MNSTRCTAILTVCTMAVVGCERQPAATQTKAPAPAAKGGHGHEHDHDHDHGDGHSHGATTQLGEQVVEGLTVKASRDGDLKAGGDAAVDIRISGGSVAAVRFWIGTQDAAGSVKARAELEKDVWHSHLEVPNPIPEGGRLWVQVEKQGGGEVLVSFDLKRD